jgi:hypothetical protein
VGRQNSQKGNRNVVDGDRFASLTATCQNPSKNRVLENLALSGLPEDVLLATTDYGYEDGENNYF